MSRQSRTGWRRMPVPVPLATRAPATWCYQREVEDGHLTVLVGPEPEGFHLSISHRIDGPNGKPVPGRYPTWDEIAAARYEFCPGDLTMVMLLPPREHYVNVHPTTFHLWELR